MLCFCLVEASVICLVCVVFSLHQGFSGVFVCISYEFGLALLWLSFGVLIVSAKVSAGFQWHYHGFLMVSLRLSIVSHMFLLSVLS